MGVCHGRPLPPPPPPRAPDDSAPVKDDEFVIESFSDRQAFTPAPDDTTVAATAHAQPPDATPKDEDTQPGAGEVKEPPDESQVSASRVTAEQQTADSTQAAPATRKNKTPLKERTVQLKHEVDTLTHTKHRTKSDVEAAERKLADLTRQIAEHETRLRSGQPSTKPDVKASEKPDDADVPMPEHPNYRAFATDEEYETAVAKWRTDLTAWHRGQNDRLEKRITQGVESRFRSAGDDAATQAAEQRLVTTLDKVRTGKADWNERAAALGEIQSSWYDPSTHGEAKTPFLSDLARTRLAMGQEDGGELLYWLGEDPDRAQALADLLPTRPVRDAIVHASSVLPLLEHFATDDGRTEFEALKQMHPLRINQAVGALSVRLAGASSGSPASAHPITKAQPSARPPAGTPGARGTTGTSATTKQTFEQWMAAEDEKDRIARERLAGLAR